MQSKQINKNTNNLVIKSKRARSGNIMNYNNINT